MCLIDVLNYSEKWSHDRLQLTSMNLKSQSVWNRIMRKWTKQIIQVFGVHRQTNRTNNADIARQFIRRKILRTIQYNPRTCNTSNIIKCVKPKIQEAKIFLPDIQNYSNIYGFFISVFDNFVNNCEQICLFNASHIYLDVVYALLMRLKDFRLTFEPSCYYYYYYHY